MYALDEFMLLFSFYWDFFMEGKDEKSANNSDLAHFYKQWMNTPIVNYQTLKSFEWYDV